MRKIFILFAFIAFISMAITSCNKRENEIEHKQHFVKYEVTIDDNLINETIIVTYIGRNNPMGDYDPYDAISLNETTSAPWSYEYKTGCENTAALLHVKVADNNETEIEAKIYVDGNVVEEKTGNDIELYYLIQ